MRQPAAVRRYTFVVTTGARGLGSPATRMFSCRLWTEIIIIFMPIFIPLLPHFNIDPLFFGLLVALNLQTAFLSPPVAMAAFYLKGVSPPHVTLNQIFAGMMPFMGFVLIALVLLYVFPGIGLWLPHILYK